MRRRLLRRRQGTNSANARRSAFASVAGAATRTPNGKVEYAPAQCLRPGMLLASPAPAPRTRPRVSIIQRPVLTSQSFNRLTKPAKEFLDTLPQEITATGKRKFHCNISTIVAFRVNHHVQ